MRKVNKKQRRALRALGKLPPRLKKIGHRRDISNVLQRHGEHLPESRPLTRWRRYYG